MRDPDLDHQQHQHQVPDFQHKQSHANQQYHIADIYDDLTDKQHQFQNEQHQLEVVDFEHEQRHANEQHEVPDIYDGRIPDLEDEQHQLENPNFQHEQLHEDQQHRNTDIYDCGQPLPDTTSSTSLTTTPTTTIAVPVERLALFCDDSMTTGSVHNTTRVANNSFYSPIERSCTEFKNIDPYDPYGRRYNDLILKNIGDEFIDGITATISVPTGVNKSAWIVDQVPMRLATQHFWWGTRFRIGTIPDLASGLEATVTITATSPPDTAPLVFRIYGKPAVYKADLACTLTGPTIANGSDWSPGTCTDFREGRGNYRPLIIRNSGDGVLAGGTLTFTPSDRWAAEWTEGLLEGSTSTYALPRYWPGDNHILIYAPDGVPPTTVTLKFANHPDLVYGFSAIVFDECNEWGPRSALPADSFPMAEFHELVKDIVLAGWSWAFTVVGAWSLASRWRRPARARERLEAERPGAEDDEVELFLADTLGEPLSLVFFFCTVAVAGVLQKLTMIPLATAGSACASWGWGKPWLTPGLLARMGAAADVVAAGSLACLLPTAYLYLETDTGANVGRRLREAAKSLLLTYALVAALFVAAGRLLGFSSIGSLFLGVLRAPMYLLCLLASPLGAEVGFRRVASAWIPLDLRARLEARNEAIEVERSYLRSQLENPAPGKHGAASRLLARQDSAVNGNLLSPDTAADRRSRSLSTPRSASRPREVTRRYARHVSITGLLSPQPNKWETPLTRPADDTPLDRESIEQQIEALDFELLVNESTARVPIALWDLACGAVYLCLLGGWACLSGHVAASLLSFLGFSPPAGAPSTSFSWTSAALLLARLWAQLYLIATSLAGLYALPALAPVRQNRSSFPHFVAGLTLLSALALAMPRVAADLGVADGSRLARGPGGTFVAFFLVRLAARGRPRWL
ncbi:hypothetical protein DFJ74DRAFT_735203 [Hyaloraphidium curvatum]|nr:hypothetical protein DFJ74DRAFT_735203 [Hyaloraphidium curvatum]